MSIPVSPDSIRQTLSLHKLWSLGAPGGERANLSHANLSHAILRCAYLRSAAMSCTNLSQADLRFANLRSANLMGANFAYSDLSGADLRGADIRGADFRFANLTDTKNLRAPHPQLPEGALIVWKKVRGGLAKLLIPEGAHRVMCLANRNCRAECAVVLSLESTNATLIDGSPNESYSVSAPVGKCLTYRVGELVKSDSYDESPFLDCTSGIHFFLTREEALEF